MARPTRRRFLGTAGGGLLGVIALLGLSAGDALGLPVGRASGETTGDERRYPIPSSDSVNIDHEAQLILVRFQGHVYVFNLACPHQQAAVKWLPRDNRFQCTKHDSKYQLDGAYMSGRATRNLDRFVLRRDGDFVVADLNRMVESDKDPAGWAAASLPV